MKLAIEDKIPCPVNEVFDAIVDPAKLANHFVVSTDGPIYEGKKVHWSFGDHGEITIQVLEVIENKLIQFQWAASGVRTIVEIKLELMENDTTKISIKEGEWKMDKDSIEKAIGQTQGWTGFIDGLKAYLLFGVNLREGKRVG